jgi:REP element-mobilizing transposase RayT
LGIYTEAYHHFVWATRKREYFITPEVERDFYRRIRSSCQKARVQVHALNGMPDHVHLVVTLPATLAPSVLIHDLKGASAHLINHLPEVKGCLYWQEGYGWLTFTQDELPRIIRYVERQKERHALGKLSPKLERAADWEQHKPETS